MNVVWWAHFGPYLIHTIRGYARAGANFVGKFIPIVAHFARSFFSVAHVLLIAQLSCFDIQAAHGLPDLGSVFAWCVRVRARA